MARIPFGRLKDTEIRKPSKVLLVLMILFILLLALSATFIVLYLKEKTKSTGQSGTCSSTACVSSAAEILDKLDRSANPCDDFYQYSCGGFLKKTHLKEDQPQLNSFTVAFDAVQNALKAILQNEQLMSSHSEGSAVYKAFTFYKSCMNENSIRNIGIEPILKEIEEHGSWNITNKNWNGDFWKLEKILARVLADFGTPAFLSWGIYADFFDTSKAYVTIGGGSSAYDRLWYKEKFRDQSRLPRKYLETEESDSDKNYKVFMSTVFKLLGSSTSNSTVEEEVNRIVNLEKEFKNFKEDLRDVEKLKKNVKFWTVKELNAFTSYKFDWQLYFDEILRDSNEIISPYKKLMILFPENIKKIIDWLTEKPKSLLANEIIWHVVRGLLDTLPAEFREAEDKYRKSSAGYSFPRWQTCNIFTDNYFRFVTTLLYVNEHLSEDARKTAEEMFKQIKKQFIDGLNEQTWMDYSTRAHARLKLKDMKDLIGFPALIKKPGILDLVYKNIDVDQYNLLRNTLNIRRVGFKALIKEVGKTSSYLDIDSVSSLTYLSINAFYSPGANRMTVLAGILQPPFYKHDRLKALNYGSLGMVVGHEITHGFDKQGSEYDEKGNIRQWWSAYSHRNFVKRSTCLIKEYNKVKIFGYQVNGNKTLSENIADNGGLKYAYRAYNAWRLSNGNEEKLPGLPFNNDQLFFVGFAQTWCAKYTRKFAKILMDKDVHSLNPVRVRVPLSNFPEFSKAFGCTPRKDTCTVW